MPNSLTVPPAPDRYPGGFACLSAREQAEAYGELYIRVWPQAARLLYTLIRASRPATVVEFGMSFGISTIHLAAAVRFVLLDGWKGLYLPVLRLLEPSLEITGRL